MLTLHYGKATDIPVLDGVVDVLALTRQGSAVRVCQRPPLVFPLVIGPIYEESLASSTPDARRRALSSSWPPR